MARVTKLGNGGAVHISVDGSGNYETVAEIKSWSVDETVDVLDTTTMTDAGVRKYTAGHKTWTGTADLYIPYTWTDTDSSGTLNAGDTLVEQLTEEDSLVTGITVGTTYDWKFYADDSVDTFESYNGKGIVTSVSRSASHDGMVEMTVTIQGTSLLT